MSRRTQTLCAIAVLAMAGTVAPAAAQQTFFGQDLRWVLNGSPLGGSASQAARDLFLSNLVGVGTEDFEGQTLGAGTPLGLTFPGAGTATLTNKGNVSVGGCCGRAATSGTKFWELGTGSSGSQFNITFSSAIAAFGVFGVDVGDFGDQLMLSFYRNSVLVDSWSPVHGLGGNAGGANDGNLNFFGYINTNNLFDELRFTSTNAIPGSSEDFWGFDDMTIGSLEQVSTVPEPATVALVATGLLGIGIAHRRKRKASL